MPKGSAQQIVIASPTKRFFVEMLTRDIDLEDAVLDLLDNCLDGVLRHGGPIDDDDPAPYKKHWAKVDFSKNSFSIADNCGGIERDLAEKYAFRMGRPKEQEEEDLPTVGMYGIGMKRAIFKMGRAATITSKTSDDAFEVAISPQWLDDDDLWKLPLREIAKSSSHGTTINITELHDTVAEHFGEQQFIDRFIDRVATHYSFIIHKGFQVSVNGKQVVPSPVNFLLRLEKGTRRGIAPFLYEGTYNDVEISMVVGFYRPTPTQDEVDEEQHVRRTREDAGWTVICNDRVVVYCDKTRLTGWGEAGVPGFHSQFIAIAGFVEFRSSKARQLPVTTTKRGIDAGSDVYLFAKNYMREGMKIFTNYTYKWKERPAEERAQIEGVRAVSLGDVRKQVRDLDWQKINKNQLKERKFLPDLPAPPTTTTEKFLRFARPMAQIRRVSGYLFAGDKDRPPSEVGAKAFDWVHEKSKS